MSSHRPDSIDWKILAALQENARIANVELADEVNLSPSPCLVRVKALEQNGYISRYATLLDPRAIGLGVNVFVQVRLEKQIESSIECFETAVGKRPEIMECYLMTGTSLITCCGLRFWILRRMRVSYPSSSPTSPGWGIFSRALR